MNNYSNQDQEQNAVEQNSNSNLTKNTSKEVTRQNAKKEVTKKLAKGVAQKSTIAAVGPVLMYGALVVFSIIVIIGIATFLMTLPGLLLAPLKKLMEGAGKIIASFCGVDQTKQVDQYEIVKLLNELEDMGYDLKGFGFLTDYLEPNDDAALERFEKEQDAFYYDEEQGVYRFKNDIKFDSLFSGEVEIGEKDKICAADSEFLYAYMVSDNYIYTIKNFNLSTTDGKHWYDWVLGGLASMFMRLSDAIIPGHLGYFEENWGRGLIAIYHESGGRIGRQGSLYSDTWLGLADKIEMNYEDKELIIKKGLLGNKYKYKLEGWVGRYGIPLEFLLSVHVGTMMPDLAYDLATSFPTEVKILLHPKDGDKYIPYISKVVNHWYRDIYFVEDSNKEFVQTDTEYESLVKERWTLYETYNEGELSGEYKLYAINSKGEYAKNPSEIRNYDRASNKLVNENGLYLFKGTQEDARQLDIAVTKKAITLNYSSEEDFDEIGWQNEDGIWTAYEETRNGSLKQKGEALRTETNPAIKMMFLYNTYFRYDGTHETAEAITQLRKENDIKLGALDLRFDLSNGDDVLEKYTTEVEMEDDENIKETYSIKDVSGKVTLNQDSLNAFSILENMHTLDAEYIYRDFKELVVELGYFTKEEMTDETPKVLAWMIPDTGCKGYPYRLLDKRENEFGTYIHSKGDIDACKDNKLALIKKMGEDDSAGGNTDSGEHSSDEPELPDPSQDPEEEDEPELEDKPDHDGDEDEHDLFAQVKGQTTRHLATSSQSFRGSDLIETATNCWKYIVDNGSRYSYASGNIPIQNGDTVDCSSYICWVLYEYGYEDFEGQRVNCEGFVNTNWNELYGWEEIPIASGENPIDILQPGDIIVRFEGYDQGQTHHTNFVVEVENGGYKAYDCGCESNWRGSAAQGGNPIDKSYFLTASGAGKIIRVEDPGSDKDDYVGYDGNEAVISPVTGILLEYGTYTDGSGINDQDEKDERTNVDMKYGGTVFDNVDIKSDEERKGENVIDKVGYAKIMLLDAENYKKLEQYTGSYWAGDDKTLVNKDKQTNPTKKLKDDSNLKSVKDLKDKEKWNNKNISVYGYKEYAERYEKLGVAGSILYMDGFICQDVDNSVGKKDLTEKIPNGTDISIDDFKNTDFDDKENQRPTEFFAEKNYKSASVEVTDRIKVENKLKKEAVPSYMLKDGDKELIFIKEGTIIGRTITDKELLEAPYLRNSQYGTYEEIRETESEDEEEKKKLIGNYIRLILRDEDGTVIENVEDYIDLDRERETSSIEKLMTWQALEPEGFHFYGIEGLRGGKDNNVYQKGHLCVRPNPSDQYGYDWVICDGSAGDPNLCPGIFMGWPGQHHKYSGGKIFHEVTGIPYSQFSIYNTWCTGTQLFEIYTRELESEVEGIKRQIEKFGGDGDAIVEQMNQDQINALIDVAYKGIHYMTGEATLKKAPFSGHVCKAELIKKVAAGRFDDVTVDDFIDTNPNHPRRRIADYIMFKEGVYLNHVNNCSYQDRFLRKNIASENWNTCYEFISDTPFQDLMRRVKPVEEDAPWNGSYPYPSAY